MKDKYLKCVNCGERWPDGVIFNPNHADCCRQPNIHIFNYRPDPVKVMMYGGTFINTRFYK